MFIVHVYIHIKADQIEAFKAVTLENAQNSLQEPGVARFDVIQQLDDPVRFMLVEVYRDEHAPALHKQTPHYARWAETVAVMMAEPRTSIKYANLFPGEDGW